MSGNSTLHETFEKELAEFVGKKDAFLLNYGYQGVMSAIECLCDHRDVIVYDAESHACLIDGIRLHKAKLGEYYKFNHNDMVSLEKNLIRATKLANEKGGGVLVITEGVFGMSGKVGDLKAIVELKKKYDFRLLVDDAHGFGTMGDLHVEDVPAMRGYAPLFAAAGIPLTLSADMAGILWAKLVVNMNNAANALSGLPLMQQLSNRTHRRALALSQHEALGLLRRAGIRPAKVFALPTWLLPYVMSLPDWLYRRVMAKGGTRIDRHARSSMAEDLAQGRRTEIDYLNGEFVALAQRLGRKAPVNARVVELVRAAEAGAPPLSADAFYRALSEARVSA